MKELLIVNDDGINSEGIAVLAERAKRYGNVTVVAPTEQCSGMSHRITIGRPLNVRRAQFNVPGVTAYMVDGTPVDCTMTGVTTLLDRKPDMVWSGINMGYNVGYDVIYSGTVSAAREALLHDVPAMAFSIGYGAPSFEVVDHYFDEIVEHLLEKPVPRNALWNTNFPTCTLAETKGIVYDVGIGQIEFYNINGFTVTRSESGYMFLEPNAEYPESGPEGTDIGAVLDNRIAVGLVECAVLKP